MGWHRGNRESLWEDLKEFVFGVTRWTNVLDRVFGLQAIYSKHMLVFN